MSDIYNTIAIIWNWVKEQKLITSNIIIGIGIIPLSIGIIYVIKEVVKTQQSALYFLLVILLSELLLYISGIMVHITLSPIWKYINVIHFIPISIFAVLFVDSITQERISHFRMGFTCFLNGLFIFALLDSDPFVLGQFSNGDWFLFWNSSPHKFTGTILSLWALGYFLYYSIYVLAQSSKQYRKYPIILFGSTLLIAVGPLLIFTLDSLNSYPHIDTIITNIGYSVFTLLFIKQPQLFYLLPFKVDRLTVLDMNSGLSIYDYNWQKKSDFIYNSVYSGLLQGIQQIIQNNIAKGAIREIITDEAVIIFDFHSKHNIAFVLISSKSSITLKKALKEFAHRFVDKYQNGFSSKSDIGQFSSATQIVDDAFYFIPKE